MKAEAYRLPQDVRADSQKWVTRPGRITWRGRDILMEFITAHLGTHHLLSSPARVTVYRITAERDDVPASEVTATDRLRVLVGTEATHPQALSVTRKALNEIVREPDEAIAAAAGGLTDALRF